MNILATNLDFGMETAEVMKALIPFVVVQYGFALYCVIDIIRKGTANLNKGLWMLICLFVSLIGPILYLTIGRRKDR